LARCVAVGAAHRASARSTPEDELPVFCPECAEREFGTGPRRAAGDQEGPVNLELAEGVGVPAWGGRQAAR
jgi:hypothetical protein